MNPQLISSSIGNHMLFLFVGIAQELITIHSDLFPQRTQQYIINQTAGLQTYQLPNEDPHIFRIYRTFLYDGFLDTVSSDAERDVLQDNSEGSVVGDVEWMRLAHCYLLGKSVEDERFANAAIDAIVEKGTEGDSWPTGLANEVYNYTSPGDRLRKLIVDIHVWRGVGEWVWAPHDDANGPAEFMRDITLSMGGAGAELYEDDAVMPWEKDLCGEYHEHAGSARCGA